MPTLRTQPYIWTTWISKILGGDNSCEWSAWYRAQYQDIPKRDRSDMDTPRLKHTSLLQRSKSRFEKEGYRVLIEDQNSFKLKGRVATLAGKPDLVAISDNAPEQVQAYLSAKEFLLYVENPARWSAPGHLKPKGGECMVNARTDKVTVTISESGTVTITTGQKRIVVIITEQGNVTTMTSDIAQAKSLSFSERE